MEPAVSAVSSHLRPPGGVGYFFGGPPGCSASWASLQETPMERPPVSCWALSEPQTDRLSYISQPPELRAREASPGAAGATARPAHSPPLPHVGTGLTLS